MHLKRLATAALLIPLLILYIVKLPPVYYASLLGLVCALALSEFYGMYRVAGALKYPGMAAGVVLFAAIYRGDGALDVLAASLLVLASVRLFAFGSPRSSLADLAPVAFGLAYIPLLLGFQLPLLMAEPGLVVFMLGAVWCADSLALYAGTWIGGRKLYEAVSPNKTVAGAAGSVAGGALGASIIKAFLLPAMPWGAAASIGLAVGLTTIIGDLVESMLKRDAGVKDSGRLLPGHGGILDKIDGSLFAGPVLFWLLSALDML